MGEAGRQKAEELMVAMARESWNDSVDRLEAIISACANLGAEIAMVTNVIPARRVESVRAAFHELEAALRPDE